jgi:CRP/FNR family cyclic AMP-dependent transcriptional regulator
VALDAAARQFLIGIPLFGGLPDMALEQLMPLIVERAYAVDEVICTEGDPGRELFIVRSGQVEVRKRLGDGGFRALARLEVGDCFGEMSLIDIQPRSASVVAVADTRLWVLTNMDLYRLYQTNLEAYAFLVQNICRELSRRLRRADGVIAEISRQSNRS